MTTQEDQPNLMMSFRPLTIDGLLELIRRAESMNRHWEAERRPMGWYIEMVGDFIDEEKERELRAIAAKK